MALDKMVKVEVEKGDRIPVYQFDLLKNLIRKAAMRKAAKMMVSKEQIANSS
jgi:hypothetical protein